jgi:hypothetical protein
MNETSFSLSTPEASTPKFTFQDIQTTLEYLSILKNRDLFAKGSETDWTGKTYQSDITDKTYQFSDRNFQEAVARVVEGWKKNLEGFAHVFQTSKGSIYFMLADKSCVRFKSDGSTWAKDSIKVMEHIFFLPEQQYAELLELHQQGLLQDAIPTLSAREQGIQAYSVPEAGLYPFEFRLRGYANEIDFQHTDGVLRITENSGPFASGYHLGHKIEAVLK